MSLIKTLTCFVCSDYLFNSCVTGVGKGTWGEASESTCSFVVMIDVNIAGDRISYEVEHRILPPHLRILLQNPCSV